MLHAQASRPDSGGKRGCAGSEGRAQANCVFAGAGMHLRLVICIGLRHAELLAQGCPRGVAEELGRLARDALALVEEVIAVDLHGE